MKRNLLFFFALLFILSGCGEEIKKHPYSFESTVVAEKDGKEVHVAHKAIVNDEGDKKLKEAIIPDAHYVFKVDKKLKKSTQFLNEDGSEMIFADNGYYAVEMEVQDACGKVYYTVKGEATAAPGFDKKVDHAFKPVADFIGSIIFVSFKFPGMGDTGVPLVLVILVLSAVFFTVYFRFINFRKFRLSIDIVRGAYSDPNESGEVSHFQALTAALSGTVGLGNIAGVALAIGIGGPGATFWMILAGLIGMSSKFVECTLGVKYREVDADGTVYGGPMYYLRQGFTNMKMVISGREHSFEGIGKVLAAVFAVAAIGGSFGGGNMFQANQAFEQLAGMPFMKDSWMAQNGWFFGMIMAVLVGIVIIGGIRSIAKVTDKIVPFMCGVYVLCALIVLGANVTEIPAAFGDIFSMAFGYKALGGGMVGVLLVGFQRAAFSNEAGIGSASIAHSAVKTNNPASEGLVALLEPFIDTVVVCTMTALVIVITGKYKQEDVDGITMTSDAFSTVIDWFPNLLLVAVILFAFSTMITWSYYGQQAWAYLFGRSKTTEYVYKAIFCGMVVLGASASLKAVIDFSDAMIFMMLFPNMIGLMFLTPVVRDELNKYLGKINSGEIKKVK